MDSIRKHNQLSKRHHLMDQWRAHVTVYMSPGLLGQQYFLQVNLRILGLKICKNHFFENTFPLKFIFIPSFSLSVPHMHTHMPMCARTHPHTHTRVGAQGWKNPGPHVAMVTKFFRWHLIFVSHQYGTYFMSP
jgi:hypothetical protein